MGKLIFVWSQYHEYVRMKHTVQGPHATTVPQHRKGRNVVLFLLTISEILLFPISTAYKPRVDMTLPRVTRDLLMLPPSFNRCPVAPEESALSLHTARKVKYTTCGKRVLLYVCVPSIMQLLFTAKITTPLSIKC